LFQDGTYVEQFTGGFNLIGPAIIQDGRGQNASITWNHTFSPTLLNTFRVGYLRHRLDFPAPEGAFGVPAYYTIDGLAEDFGHYYGGAYLASAAVVPSTGKVPDFYRGYRANEMAGFVEDDWRVNNRLTLNLGLRWEYFGPPHNFKPGIDSNFYFGSNVAPISQL